MYLVFFIASLKFWTLNLSNNIIVILISPLTLFFKLIINILNLLLNKIK
jgi:hypothetical protein